MDPANPTGPARTLLIVEDEILAAMAIKGELEDAGYIVMDLTTRHREAASAARECKPDLALVNIELQGRDSGIALAEELKTMGVPVLFISGQTSRARSAQTVAIASMPKPYSASDMVMAVHYLLARIGGDDTLSRPAGLEVFEADLESDGV